MMYPKSLHKSDDPIVSVTYGATSIDDEISDISMVKCPYCHKSINESRLTSHLSV